MNSFYRSLTPTATLNKDETVITSFTGNKRTYIRDHIWLAGFAMLFGMAALWLFGNAHIWTGAVGGFFAIAIRGFYLASDDLKARWDLTNQRIMGPQERIADLTEIVEMKVIISSVQLITQSGLKHLIRFQVDPQDTIAQIEKVKVQQGATR
ncbi:hypothetical protein [Halocynthiibacter namhaensis]|uniref:hypothetical protein n=1 Tax=Halocynthiibacter namhaensis TaxID=1290553 RepID=UPI00068C1DF4|nr:hypothetical protein [Halocynthiibacter namhaensis]